MTTTMQDYMRQYVETALGALLENDCTMEAAVGYLKRSRDSYIQVHGNGANKRIKVEKNNPSTP